MAPSVFCFATGEISVYEDESLFIKVLGECIALKPSIDIGLFVIAAVTTLQSPLTVAIELCISKNSKASEGQYCNIILLAESLRCIGDLLRLLGTDFTEAFEAK